LKKVNIEATTDIETLNQKGEPITITNVPAIKNPVTGKISVLSDEVIKAGYRMLTDEIGLIPRDLPIMVLLWTQLGIFETEKMYRHDLNRALFYQWAELQEYGINSDDFEKGEAVNLSDDLNRLEKKGFIEIEPMPYNQMLRLTDKGLEVAKHFWSEISDRCKLATLTAQMRKMRI